MPRLSRRRLLSTAVGLLLLLALPGCESKRQLMLGRFFQMQRKGDTAAAAPPRDEGGPEVPMEPIRVDPQLLQEQLEGTRMLLQEKERESSQEFARLTQYIAELESRLEGADNSVQERSEERRRVPADPAPAGGPPSDVDPHREALRRELDDEWTVRYNELDSTFQDSLRVATVQNEQLRDQLELYEEKAIELQKSIDAQLEDWIHEKQELTEINRNLVDELTAALEEKKFLGDFVNEIKEEVNYWKSAFHNRAYVNATHLADLADILLTVASAPVVDAACSVYHNHIKGAVDKGYDALAPLYDKLTAAVSVEFIAVPAKVFQEKLHVVLRECRQLWRQLWSRVIQDLTGIVQSSCEVGLQFIGDDEKRSRIQAVCHDPKPIVLTIGALPIVVIFSRLFVWLFLWPIKFLIRVIPVKINDLLSQTGTFRLAHVAKASKMSRRR